MLNPEMPDAVKTPQNFQESAVSILEFLAARIPFGLWMITRAEGEHGIVLFAIDRDYGIKDGTVFRWSDSVGSRMATGLGPRVAPRSCEIPAYVDAPVKQRLSIESFVGAPIYRNDGSLFGTLSAIDKKAKSDRILKEQAIVELLADLLGTLLDKERQIDGERRRAERAEADSMVDELTELGNRRAWERTVEAEEARCARYGDPASVLIIDLDDLKRVNDRFGHEAGDTLLRSAANAIRSSAREGDFAARIGGDEFAILAVHANVADTELIAERVISELRKRKVNASVGTATRHPSYGLNKAIILADTRMYEAKQRHHTIPPR